MAWYDSAVFYLIYPIGLCGCSHENTGACENHFDKLNEWASHAAKLGCTAIYIGPLFESEGHGYETVDYRKVDRRLGTNEDFKQFVVNCHNMGVKVIVDGVFNHTGRGFFAFQDLLKNRENSRYKDWYCNVNFWSNNEYNDGFSYENWGGYNLLVKLNQRNTEVKDYIFDSVRMWVNEFDIDGIRLDAADVLDHDFMHDLRAMTDSLKPEFWLMGEVIHGDYSRWANSGMLHSVTNYELHKGLFSGHNDHNYFEIAHSIKRLLGICGSTRLYTFVDNHDVARIYTKLNNKAHIFNVMILDYLVPGIPSIYYGSEFGIDGPKVNGNDWIIRPCLELADYDKAEYKPLINLIKRLGRMKKELPEVTYGDYRELYLTTRQFAFARVLGDKAVIVLLNNDDNVAHVELGMPINANKAEDLLTAPLEEETVEKKEETPTVNKDLLKALEIAISHTHSLEEKLKEAYDKAQELADMNTYAHDIKTGYARLEMSIDSAVTEMLPEQFNAFSGQINGCAEMKLDNNRLIVDIPANSGMVVRIS